MAKKKKEDQVLAWIGVVDTMFARYDMGAAARDELAECPGYGKKLQVLSADGAGLQGPGRRGEEHDRARRSFYRHRAGHARDGADRQTVRPRGLPGHHARPN